MSDIHVGVTLGSKYIITKPIGIGGFGSIYCARNLLKSERDTEKYVAVKVEKCVKGEKRLN
jgi:serine/threonine protein kinase